MILGILSDTHGQAAVARRALGVLEGAGAEAFVHCGDVGGEAVLRELAGRRAWFVWGNTDDPSPALLACVRAAGLPLPGKAPQLLELAGRRLVVFHGHETLFIRFAELAAAGRTAQAEAVVGPADYVLCGHAHRRLDVRVGRIRVINPGALYRASPRSVASLDLERDKLRYWRVDERPCEGDTSPVELPGGSGQ